MTDRPIDPSKPAPTLRDAAAEIGRLRAAIQAFVEGDYPNPACHRPGRCAHGTLHTDECAECAAEYFRGVLGDAGRAATGAGQADPTHPFIAANAGAMFRWIVGIACNTPDSPVHPGLRAEMDAFMGRAIRAGIDVIAISEEP